MQAENNALPLPELDEFLTAIDDMPVEEDHAGQFAAALTVSVSAVLGLCGNALFHDSLIGINVFLYTVLCLLAAFAGLFYFRHTIVWKHAMFAVPAAIFALLLGIRLAPQLILFNGASLFGCLVIVIYFTGTRRFLNGKWLSPIHYGLDLIMFGWIESVRAVVPASMRWAGQTELNNRQFTTAKSVLRGVLLALPILAVFVLLLSSADMVFSNFAEKSLAFLLPASPNTVIEQLILTSIFTVVSLTMIWTVLHSRLEAPDSMISAGLRKTGHCRLNIIETSVVLGSVNGLFVAFVVIQARYLFGGEANITAQGYTYADYARRGFYELLAVSCMTMALLVILERLTYRKREEETLFRGLVTLMVLLTFVILFAAFQRLNLYENAYGYTRIRMMSATFMIWLAVLLGALLIAIIRHHPEVLVLGGIVAGLGFGLTLNVMNMDAFIARHNIERYEETHRLDVDYLLLLSDDAIPVVAKLLERTDLDEYARAQLLDGLGQRLAVLDQDRERRGTFGYHIGKARAWQALDDYRALLQPYAVPDRLSNSGAW